MKNLIRITLPAVLICLVLVELILSIWFPVADPYQQLKESEYNPYIPSEFPPHLKLELASDEGIAGLDKRMRFTTNNAGFRGDQLIQPKPDNEFRVFIVGGSTTACFYQDDKKSLDFLLQSNLAQSGNKLVKVYNAGKPGDASPDHLSMLTNRLIHLQPDLMILFASLNDFSKNISKYDYSHFGKQPFPSALRWHQKSTRFQIARRVYYAFVSEERYRQQITMKTRYRRFVAYEQSFPLSDSTPYINTEDYRKNLEGFAGTCQYNKIPVIFMTNQTTWGTTDSILQRSHWLCIRSGVRYRHQKMDSGLNVYNNAMRAVAEAHAIPLFDLPAIIPKSRQYFYDDCHFTNEGVAFTARSLAVFIREKNILQ